MKNYILTSACLICLFLLQSCCCNDADEPTGLIDCSIAVEMNETYLSSNPGATGDVTFDFKEMQDYFCKIEEVAKDSSYTNLGFRVYFAETDGPNGVRVNTVFFAPTYESGGNTFVMTELLKDHGDIGNNGGDINCNP
ncbi:hypothetical protein [Altibacter sp. HG106]|uniref:hypothetical protein n=1 Tax=Altibacter sp. HG106 TaxID=3023937 RepID=UPI0023500F6D|nr:hypothetical protein [Altibacter sp. HG106]MDC7993893.1 hypothetical protein [Altibacter sp. HG106]